MDLRPIPGYDPVYFAGSDGYIYSTKGRSGVVRRLVGSFDGQRKYLHVWAYPLGKKRVSKNVHVLVCTAFHGEKPFKGATASHIDGNRLNNTPSNLVWESQSENLARKSDHGTHDRGLNNSRSVLSERSLREIRDLLEVHVMTHKEIGDAYGVSRTVITRINSRTRYNDF